MTDTPTASPGDAHTLEWIQAFAESFAQVLGRLPGSALSVEVMTEAPADALPPADSDLQTVITAAGSLRGEMSLRLTRNTVLALAQLFLGESSDPAAEFKPEHREAAEELLRQVGGHAATNLKPRWGEVHLRLEFASPPSWPAGASGWLASAAGAPLAFWLEWQLSAALVVALTGASASPGAAPVQEAVPAAPPAEATGGGGRLGLLMDVELDVTLRFGGKRLLLRDILELGPGSVVELDRQVQEPADLLLDGKLIARGEVVVVEGCYGLRVLEVISPPG